MQSCACDGRWGGLGCARTPRDRRRRQPSPPVPPLTPPPFPSPSRAQSPNSFFMDVRCPTCYQITTVFSHATTVVVCGSCALMLCQPTGGKCRLTEGCSYRKKAE
jgi:small subunit ribosomal protein S27e